MLKANDIKKATFSNAKVGYNKDEVDALLDKIESDYEQYDNLLTAQQTRIAALEKELEDKDISMNSINTVLISAQKLAENIVSDAKTQAEETVANANSEAESIKLRTKKALEEIDAVLTEQKKNAQAQVDIMLEEAARKSEGMILAAKDSVTREQLLFDKLKSEVAEFKKQIKDAYKMHLDTLSKLPDEVSLNPEMAASAIDEIINNEPDLLKFIEKTPVVVEVEEKPVIKEEIKEEAPEVEELVEEIPSAEDEFATAIFEPLSEEELNSVLDVQTVDTPAATGFVINHAIEDDDEDTEIEDDGPTFTKGFFAKHK